MRLSRRGALAAGAVGAVAVAGGAGVAATTLRQGRADPPPARVGTFLLGLNVSGLEDPVPAAPTRAMLAAYAAHGIAEIRLPGLWDHAQPRVGGALDEAYLATYAAVLDGAASCGLGVVVEPCHNYGGRRVEGTTRKLGEKQLPVEAFADFWHRFVTRFGDHEAITAWDLMNEPDEIAGRDQARRSAVWTEAARAAIGAIRETGDERTVKVEGCGHSSAEAWARNNPALHELADPADRLVFSAHCYLDRDNSGRHYYWDAETDAGDDVSGGPLTSDVGARRIAPFTDWLRTHGRRGEIGECGAGRRDAPGSSVDAGWLIALDTTLRQCRTDGLPFYFWGTGVHLVADYGYSLEPDPDGGEAPQWQVLDRYA